MRAVGTEEVLARAGVVAKSTLYRHFASKEELVLASKEELVLAFPQRREHRWTREFVEAEGEEAGSTPRQGLLAIFDVFDEWVPPRRLEGCSFINVLLEIGDLDSPLGEASAAHLEYIRSVVRTLAEEAGVRTPKRSHTLAHLDEGLYRRRGEGDLLAARRARAMGEDLLDRYLRVTIDPPQPVPGSSERATAA